MKIRGYGNEYYSPIDLKLICAIRIKLNKLQSFLNKGKFTKALNKLIELVEDDLYCVTLKYPVTLHRYYNMG